MLGNVQNFLPKVSLELLNGNNLCACAGMSQLSSRYPVLLYSRKWGFKYPNTQIPTVDVSLQHLVGGAQNRNLNFSWIKELS